MLRRGSVLVFLYSIQTSLMSRLGGALGLCVGIGINEYSQSFGRHRRGIRSSEGGDRSAGGKLPDDHTSGATFTYRPLGSGIRSGFSFFPFDPAALPAPGAADPPGPASAAAAFADSAATFSSSIFCAIAPTASPMT